MNNIQRLWHDLPLASKIALFASLLVVLIVPALTMLTIQREREDFRQELETQAYLLLDTLSERLRDHLLGVNVEEIGKIAGDIIGHQEIKRFKVYNQDGVLWVDASQPDKYIPKDKDPLHPHVMVLAPDSMPDFYEENGELIVEIGVWTVNDRVGFVQMGFSTAPLDEKIRLLTCESFTLAAVALVLGVLLATLMARPLTNPIRELTRTANKMATGDLSTRFQPGGRDEISQLGHAFNDLASAVEKRETDLRNLANSLEQTVNERTWELQQKNQYLAALHEVTLGLIENLDVERLLEAIMTRAASLANTEHAFIYIIDPEQGEMDMRVAQGYYCAHLGMRTDATRGLSGRVVTSGQMMIETDYQEFEDKDPSFDWLRTAIYVPLRSEFAILGVIGLGYDKVVPVNSNHIEILNQFAQLASLALKNAELYSATQQELLETEQALFAEEERRRAYQTSPQGRAEFIAHRILKDPSQALVALHDFTQKADEDDDAVILPELPGVLERMGHPLPAQLAEGYHFIYKVAQIRNYSRLDCASSELA